MVVPDAFPQRLTCPVAAVRQPRRIDLIEFFLKPETRFFFRARSLQGARLGAYAEGGNVSNACAAFACGPRTRYVIRHAFRAALLSLATKYMARLAHFADPQ